MSGGPGTAAGGAARLKRTVDGFCSRRKAAGKGPGAGATVPSDSRALCAAPGRLPGRSEEGPTT